MATLLEGQIDDWERRGVISPDIAKALRADIGSSLPGAASKAEARSRFSFFQVLVAFAAISFAAAIAMFIASNWELIPRVVRAAATAGVMSAGFIGGALARNRFGKRGPLIEEALYVVGAAGFVALVALIAQMYHLSGDIRQTALLYAGGIGLAAAALRSPVLAVIAAAWLTYWRTEGPDADRFLTPDFPVHLAAMAAAWWLCHVSGARWLKRIVLLVALAGLLPPAWGVVEDVIEWFSDLPDNVRIAFWAVLFAAGLAILVAEKMAPENLRTLPLLRKPRINPAFGLALVALAGLHAELGDKYQDGGLLFIAVVSLAFAVYVLYAHGRDHLMVRYFCYALFLGEIALVYSVTIYSLLGTSGFFLAVAIFLTLAATIVYRFEKRFRTPEREA